MGCGSIIQWLPIVHDPADMILCNGRWEWTWQMRGRDASDKSRDPCNSLEEETLKGSTLMYQIVKSDGQRFICADLQALVNVPLQ